VPLGTWLRSPSKLTTTVRSGTSHLRPGIVRAGCRRSLARPYGISTLVWRGIRKTEHSSERVDSFRANLCMVR
jgi:hypothetical protein